VIVTGVQARFETGRIFFWFPVPDVTTNWNGVTPVSTTWTDKNPVSTIWKSAA